MNPIGLLCIGLASGCGAGLVVMLAGLRTAQDAVPAPEPDELDVEWASIAEEVGDELKTRQAARSQRADTLRGIYLAGLRVDAQKPGEVPA